MYSKNAVIPGSAETLVLAVKPQQLDAVLTELASLITADHLVISIAAGKKLAGIESLLPSARVIRVMPNLACLVAEGMSVLCPGSKATPADIATATKLLSCFGKVLELPEEKFDAVTALSGSGPAFLTYLLNGLVAAGVEEGLTRQDALLLAEQTMLGTAKILIEKGTDPQELIQSVTSAKGTTAAGLAVMENSDILAVLRKTIGAAADRSKELSAS
jgi:pyrroline-5-carboxylate reductase